MATRTVQHTFVQLPLVLWLMASSIVQNLSLGLDDPA